MKIRSVKTIAAAFMSMVLLAACASSPKKDLALEQVRAQMDELQADTALVAMPLAVAEAERSASGGNSQRDKTSGFM
jgi:outer membrane murein-binding lipoprotein Lpp